MHLYHIHLKCVSDDFFIFLHLCLPEKIELPVYCPIVVLKHLRMIGLSSCICPGRCEVVQGPSKRFDFTLDFTSGPGCM